MSIIHIVDRQNDTIIDDITEKYILDNTHERSLKDVIETFEFVTFGDKRFSQYLQKRNKIIIPDENEQSYREFVISETEKIHENETVEIEVFCDASYLELKKASVIEPQTFSEYTPQMYVSRALRDTAWQAGIIEGSGYRTITFEDYTNPYDLLRKVAKEFNLELNFRVEIDGNRIIGRFVDLVKRIGKWQGVEVEFGKNLKGIRRIENTDNIVTALIGLGPERDDGTRIQVLVTDDDALQRWGIRDKNGRLQHLIEVHEIQSDNKEMTKEEVEEYTRRELNKRINSVVEYEASIHDLEHIPVLKNYKIGFGDTIRIKDKKFNPPLYLEARIHTQKRDIVDKSKKEVVLGDYEEFTEDEVKAIWRGLQSQIQRKIDLYQLLEHTYDKKTIDEKDAKILSDSQKYSLNVAQTAERNAKDHAEIVASEAERLAKEYADGQINQSESRILEKAVAKAIFETTVSELLDKLADKADNSVIEEMLAQLADKAEVEWVEGQLQLKADNSTVTAINETVNELQDISATLEQTIADYAEELENQGGKIITLENNLDTVEGELTTTITTLRNLEETVSQQQTQIEANSSQIALKADQNDVDTLTETVNSISGELTVLAGQISAKAEQSTVEELEGNLNKVSSDLASLVVDVEGIQTDVSTLTQTVTDHGTKISDINSSITQLSGLIESKVDSTTYEADIDGIIKNLQNHETRISQTETDITSKVEKSDFQSLQDQVGNIGSELEKAQTQIQQNANSIKSKADITTVNTLSGQISNIESTIQQHANMIASKVEKSEFDSVTNSLANSISTIEQRADGISLEVQDIKANVYTKSEVDSAIDGIQVGGRNLLIGSDTSKTFEWNSTEFNQEMRKSSNIRFYPDFKEMRGKEITISADIKAENLVKGNNRFWAGFEFSITYADGTRSWINFVNKVQEGTYDWKRVYATYRVADKEISSISGLTILLRDATGKFFMKNLKVEFGNKATDWTPAPEDVQDQINDIKGTLVSHNTKIEQNAQQIQLRATKAEVNTLTGRISNIEGELNLMPDKISSRIAETAIGFLGSNLIPNGSFELDHFGWESGGTIVNDGHSGSKSLRVNALPTGYHSKALSKLIPVIPGRTYEISFWVKTSSDCNGTGNNQKLRIGKKDGSLINQATFGWDGARTEWTRFSRLWTVPSDINEIQVSIVNNHTRGWVQWDDISIVDVTNENEVRQYAESQITQLVGEIATKVEKDGVISAINQTAEQIKIQASKVDLSGYVTFTNLSTPGQTTIDGGNLKTGSITADKLNVTSLSAISANLGTVTAGSLTGVTLRSDDGEGNSVVVENGSIISKINNRDMVKIKNYNIYFYDSGQKDPTPNYSEAGRIGSTWGISNPEFRGLSIIGSKDYVSITRSISETESRVWARFDFKNRSTQIYGSDDTTDAGKLHLYSTYKGGTANGRVPAIEIENFTDSNGTPWSGVFVYTGRDNRVPNNNNFRSGFEVWQYRGTKNGAAKQMLKIDTGSNGTTYTGIFTDEALLPRKTFIEDKNGSYYYPCLITISSDIKNVHGDYDGPVTVYVGRTTISIKASENYTYKRISFSWTENIFFAIAQPYGANSVFTNARIYNQSSTGFDLYLAWNSDAARADRVIQVRFLVLLERSSA